jgi:hypothetical protein
MNLPTKMVFPLTDMEILAQLSEIERKKDFLLMLQKATLSKASLFVFASYPKTGTYQQFTQLDNSHFPFDLSTEIKNLIEDSIEEYNRQIEALKFMFTA